MRFGSPEVVGFAFCKLVRRYEEVIDVQCCFFFIYGDVSVGNPEVMGFAFDQIREQELSTRLCV